MAATGNLQDMGPTAPGDAVLGRRTGNAPLSAAATAAKAWPDAPPELIEEAAGVFKTLGHEGRLLILCHLARGPQSVGELENLLDLRQSAVSQQLARLRIEGLVTARRDGKTIVYSLKDPRIGDLLLCYARIFGHCDRSPA